MNNNEVKKFNAPLIYAIVGVALLVIAVSGSAYAFYVASAADSTTIKGTAAGGGATLTVSKQSTAASGGLIPIDMTTDMLTKAAKGWTGTAVGTGWNASYACKDKNGYSVCQIYAISLKNTSSNAVSYNIGVTSLTGPTNIDVVKMASNISVTSATSIKGNTTGVASNVSVPANGTSPTYYIMILLKNTSDAQTDSGSFSGTVTATSTAGNQLKATFS